MRLLLALVAGLTLLPACAASPPPSALPSREAPDPRALTVDRLFARWARPDSPGCAVAVSEDGHVLHARGYGMADLEHGVALSPGTSFHVAFVFKQFTALAVLDIVSRQQELNDVFADDDGRVIHIVRAADNHVTGFTLSTGRVRHLRFVRRSG